MARRSQILIAIAALFMAAGSSTALAQGTAFTYQGELQSSGSPVNSPADFEFRLFDAVTGGGQVGSTVTRSGVSVTSGLFIAPVDFGVNPYTSNRSLFLEIAVRNPAGSGSFVVLGSRQALTPTPFSLATRGLNVDASGNLTLTRDTNRTLSVAMEPAAVPGGSNGRSLTLLAGSAATSGGSFASLGGNLILQAGSAFNGTQPNVPGGDTIIRSGANALSASDGLNGGSVILQTGSLSNTFVERMRITPAGNVGIGTTNPLRKLSVAGHIVVDSDSTNDGTNLNSSSLTFGTDLSGEGIASTRTVGGANRFGLDFFTFNTRRMSITSNGNVGIGTDAPAARLHNVGTTRLDDALQFGVQNFTGAAGSNARMYRFGTGGNVTNLYLDMTASAPGSSFIFQANGNDRFFFDLSNGTAAKTGGGAWGVLSDERTKNDIQPMTGTLDRLLKLKGHAYSYKPEFVENGRALPGMQVGLVAQEVETIFPDWVTTGADGLKQVTERSTTALMVEALRDLRTEKDTQIAQRDAELASLKARMEKLEAMLTKQAAISGK